VKFTLSYDGKLHASGSVAEKWDIRRHVQPQLQELWQTSAVLKRTANATVPPPEKGGWVYMEQHHDVPEPSEITLPRGYRRLCDPLEVSGKKFLPLVRQSLSLVCKLDILFLRKEEPGGIITQSGDIDNRLKTLFDGLRMPTPDDMHLWKEDAEPFYCLLESDALITDFGVRTGRLLTNPNADSAEVRQIIDVTIRAIHVRSYNLPLIGD
jgi:hypothetical protein